MMPRARLLTIPFSHYCEKARWAADHVGLAYAEEGYLPGFHVRPVRAAGGKTVPVLVVADRVLTDSSDIMIYCAAHAPAARRLYPDGAALRDEVRRIEETCDDELGVATRLLAYHHGLPYARRFTKVLRPSLTATQAFVLPLALTVLGSRMRAIYRITAEAAVRAEETTRRIFDDLGARLKERPFLSGDHFGAADITFASLASPVVLPAGHPKTLSTVDGIPPSLRALVLELRGTPAGAHVMSLYRDHRTEATAP